MRNITHQCNEKKYKLNAILVFGCKDKFLWVVRHVTSNKSQIVYSVQASAPSSAICGSIDIRNTVDSLNKLRGCRVIEEHLMITLMDKFNETDYDDMVFPELTEVTDFVLLYRVNGLKSVGKLFPNLRIIRGNHLLNHHSFVVYEMTHLEVNPQLEKWQSIVIFMAFIFLHRRLV